MKQEMKIIIKEGWQLNPNEKVVKAIQKGIIGLVFGFLLFQILA